MQLRYNYRLYPVPGQRRALAKAFGCARVAFSDGLRETSAQWKNAPVLSCERESAGSLLVAAFDDLDRLLSSPRPPALPAAWGREPAGDPGAEGDAHAKLAAARDPAGRRAALEPCGFTAPALREAGQEMLRAPGGEEEARRGR